MERVRSRKSPKVSKNERRGIVKLPHAWSMKPGSLRNGPLLNWGSSPQGLVTLCRPSNTSRCLAEPAAKNASVQRLQQSGLAATKCIDLANFAFCRNDTHIVPSSRSLLACIVQGEAAMCTRKKHSHNLEHLVAVRDLHPHWPPLQPPPPSSPPSAAVARRHIPARK